MGENVTKSSNLPDLGDLKDSQCWWAGVLVVAPPLLPGLTDLARKVSHSEESVDRLEGEEGKKISMGVE